MTRQYYISIPIVLSKEEVGDLIELDANNTDLAVLHPLTTLVHLNAQIVTQLAEYCAQHHTADHLPISIHVTPLLPLIRGI